MSSRHSKARLPVDGILLGQAVLAILLFPMTERVSVANPGGKIEIMEVTMEIALVITRVLSMK